MNIKIIPNAYLASLNSQASFCQSSNQNKASSSHTLNQYDLVDNYAPAKEIRLPEKEDKTLWEKLALYVGIPLAVLAVALGGLSVKGQSAANKEFRGNMNKSLNLKAAVQKAKDDGYKIKHGLFAVLLRSKEKPLKRYSTSTPVLIDVLKDTRSTSFVINTPTEGYPNAFAGLNNNGVNMFYLNDGKGDIRNIRASNKIYISKEGNAHVVLPISQRIKIGFKSIFGGLTKADKDDIMGSRKVEFVDEDKATVL
ncbi:MAG: hypothetical protein QNJ31_05975 [Candidatus Caenarcaniphilales bacterium]|nr:hypothetical protein [Candidatus Caenarcaniphilales bacterium]